MGKFKVIPQDAFNGLQMDAGVILRTFNPATPVAPNDSDIICATTGGITISCVPTYSDFASDVDNAPLNLKEFKHLDSWESKMSFTSLGTTAELIRMSLGAADVNAETSAIVPRKDLVNSDFSDIWWVGDRADGGCVAVQLKNALSTAGFSLKTTNNGKGNIDCELTGHVSINAQAEMPMVIYSIDPSTEYYHVTQTLSHVTSDYTSATVAAGDDLEISLTADDTYTIDNVSVLKNGVIVAGAWDSATGKVTINDVDGDITVIASASV